MKLFATITADIGALAFLIILPNGIRLKNLAIANIFEFGYDKTIINLAEVGGLDHELGGLVEYDIADGFHGFGGHRVFSLLYGRLPI